MLLNIFISELEEDKCALTKPVDETEISGITNEAIQGDICHMAKWAHLHLQAAR